MIRFIFVCLLCTVLLTASNAFVIKVNSGVTTNKVRLSTSLFAHRPKLKAVKRMNDRRPKKSRPSDINRRNKHHNLCFTKLIGLPVDIQRVPDQDVEEVKRLIAATNESIETDDSIPKYEFSPLDEDAEPPPTQGGMDDVERIPLRKNRGGQGYSQIVYPKPAKL